MEEKYPWQQFEIKAFNYHVNKYNTKAWLWYNVPQMVLYDAGYIHDYSLLRQKRIEFITTPINNEEYDPKRVINPEKYINPYCDYGLDGIEIDSRGIYNGLQMKYYKDNVVTCSDVATFSSAIANMRVKNIQTKGYLYTTTKLEKTFSGDVKNQKTLIHEILPYNLSQNVYSGEEDTESETDLDETDYILRDYQKEAIEFLNSKPNKFKNLELFCGGGKTLIAGYHLAKIQYPLVIVIAPLRISVDNLYTRLAPFMKEYSQLLVDSDAGGTTDTETVRGKVKNTKKLAIFATFESAVNVISKALTKTQFNNAYLLVDEVHNIVNRNDVCEFINKFTNGVFMSATIPNEMFNRVKTIGTYKRTLQYAIDKDWSVDYRLWLPMILPDKSVDIEIPEDFPKTDVCAQAHFLVTGMLQTGSRRCIVYCKTRTDVDEFVEEFKKVCDIYHQVSCWIEKIDFTISTAKRRQIINDFQTDAEDPATLHIIASVQILDEAVDIPRCDSEFITFIGVNASEIRAVQRLQRGGRLDSTNPNKINNLFVWATVETNMLSMISLLRTTDPELHKKIRRMDGTYDKIHETERRKECEKQTIRLSDYSKITCIDYDFCKRVLDLRDFIENNKCYPREAADTYEERSLVSFVKYRRDCHRKKEKSESILNAEKEYMKLYCPNFIWDPKNELHYIRLAEILEFNDKYNDWPRSRGKRSPNETSLAQYIFDRRQEYKNGILLNDIRDLIIEKIPTFVWDANAEYNYVLIKELTEFVDIHDRLPKHLADKSLPESILAKKLSGYRNRKYDNKKSSDPEIDAELIKIHPDIETWLNTPKTIREKKDVKENKPKSKKTNTLERRILA